jgi:hypothetical protein
MDQEKVVAEFVKNQREHVRAIIKTWNGRELFDLRVYYQDPTGKWVPGTKGLCLQAAALPELKAAVLALEQALGQEGLPNESAQAH